MIVVMIVLLITGCATNNTGAEFSQNTTKPKSDTGTIVFYRPHQGNFMWFGGSIGRWAIAANDKVITALGDATYTVVELPPGQYKFNGKTQLIDTIENIEIKPGTIQYIRAVHRGFSWWNYLILKEVDQAFAEKELQGLPLQINPENWTYILSHGD